MGGDVASGEDPCTEHSAARRMLTEYRLRLLMGLKQYYHAKHDAGTLSSSSFKVGWWAVSDVKTAMNRLWFLAHCCLLVGYGSLCWGRGGCVQ